MQVLTVLVGSLDSRVFPNRAECKRLKLSPHAPIWRPIDMFSSRETFFDCGVPISKSYTCETWARLVLSDH